MKQFCLLVLLFCGLGVYSICRNRSTPANERSAQLVNKAWVWTSWTEQVGNQPPLERITACMQDDVIWFEQVDGANIYKENAGAQQCSPPSDLEVPGRWAVSTDGRTLQISGGSSAFEDNWHIAELTATSLKLAYHTTTSAGPFVMTMSFAKR